MSDMRHGTIVVLYGEGTDHPSGRLYVVQDGDDSALAIPLDEVHDGLRPFYRVTFRINETGRVVNVTREHADTPDRKPRGTFR